MILNWGDKRDPRHRLRSRRLSSCRISMARLGLRLRGWAPWHHGKLVATHRKMVINGDKTCENDEKTWWRLIKCIKFGRIPRSQINPKNTASDLHALQQVYLTNSKLDTSVRICERCKPWRALFRNVLAEKAMFVPFYGSTACHCVDDTAWISMSIWPSPAISPKICLEQVPLKFK